MGKKFNELAELRDRNRQLMDENRKLRLALKVSEGRVQQLAWKKAELEKQVEKERCMRELLLDIAKANEEALRAIGSSVQKITEVLIQKEQDALRAHKEKAAAQWQELHELEEEERGCKC